MLTSLSIVSYLKSCPSSVNQNTSCCSCAPEFTCCHVSIYHKATYYSKLKRHLVINSNTYACNESLELQMVLVTLPWNPVLIMHY